jgi:hypothetical protein
MPVDPWPFRADSDVSRDSIRFQLEGESRRCFGKHRGRDPISRAPVAAGIRDTRHDPINTFFP